MTVLRMVHPFDLFWRAEFARGSAADYLAPYLIVLYACCFSTSESNAAKTAARNLIVPKLST